MTDNSANNNLKSDKRQRLAGINSEYTFVTILSMVNIFLIGSTVFLLSATKTNLMEAYGIGLAGIGFLITLRGLINGVLPIVFGRLSDKIGRRPVILAGIILFLAAYISIPSFGVFSLLIFTIVVLSMGFSLIDAASQSVLFDAHENPIPLMPFVQISFAIGALTSPLFVSILLERGIDWRLAYHFYAFLIFVHIMLLLKVKFPPLADKKRNEEVTVAFKRPPSFKKEGLTICFFIFFVAIINSTISEWGDVYFREVYNFSDVWSVRVLSLFQLGCIIGAVINFLLTSKLKLHASRLLSIELSVALIAYTINLFFSSGILSLALFILIGMCVGTLFSLSIGIIGTLFRGSSGTATGAILCSSSIGIAISAALTGRFISIIGIGNIFSLLAIIILCALILSLIIKRQYSALC